MRVQTLCSFGCMAVVFFGMAVSVIHLARAADDAPPPAQKAPKQAEKPQQQPEQPRQPADIPRQPTDIEEQIRQLIDQLGDDDYFVRERAQEELAKFSFEAFDALNAATTDRDLEIAARAKYLLRLMRVEWTTKDDPPEVKRLLSAYELQTEKSKVETMQELAKLPKGSGVAALCRLVRYEKSPVLSRRAALQLLGSSPVDEKLAKIIRSQLKGSRRPAAAWVLTYLRLGDDLEGVIKDWVELVKAEQKVQSDSPDRTRTEILTELVRLQISWLKAAGQTDRAMVATRKLIELEDGNPQRLILLLQWLIEKNEWSMVDELYAKFKPRFHENSQLLYTLAEARLIQGNSALADKTAAKALKLNPGRVPTDVKKHIEVADRLFSRKRYRWAAKECRHIADQVGGDAVVEFPSPDDTVLIPLAYCLMELKSWKELEELGARFAPLFNRKAFLLYGLARARHELGKREEAGKTTDRARKLNPGKDSKMVVRHLRTAYRLQNAGLFRWAEAEYQHVIETDATKGRLGITAKSWLAEMWHDQGEDGRAAELLKTLVDSFGKDAPDSTNIGSLSSLKRTLGDVRSRMYYFFAFDAQKKNTPAKQRESLDKAIAVDPPDLDALIACHRLPNQTPEFKENLQKLIDKEAGKLRNDIKGEPDQAAAYNQLAWLIGNTAGDLDEALKCSKTAVGRRPESGGYLDTLAHVYFARGDYEMAVKTQIKAARYEPHSGVIARKLDVFKKKLEEENKKK